MTAAGQPGLCRLCTAYCPILVTARDGRIEIVAGNPDAGFHGGYTCPKGRALPEQHNGPARLLHSLKREDGAHREISSDAAMDEIAAKIDAIVARHGPRSVALYFGMGVVPQPTGLIVAASWMAALGSRMMFSAGSIDKPGIMIAQALHGNWQAGEPVFHEADAWILVGINPVISKGPGFAMQNPGKLLKDAEARGAKLVVIDPRCTETARRAAIHLQPRPGRDPAILACLIKVIIAEARHDAAFVSENVAGFKQLASAVAPFTPDAVAQMAGVSADELIAAARIFAGAKRAGISCGTGPSFATHGTLTEYLGLCLASLCGQWRREGDAVAKPNVLLPAYVAKAQPFAPYPAWGFGEQLRVRGLGGCVSGLAASALADEILLEGDGQVRALICLGSNPMMAWPDQHRAHRALTSLDLLVTLSYEITATARIADYVIAPRLTLETPATTWLTESAKYAGTHRGLDRPFAQYTPRLADPPPGSDVIEDWEFFYGLGKRQGLQLEPAVAYGAGQHLEHPTTSFRLDMTTKPSSDELLEQVHAASRVPLAEVKRHPNGRIFDEVAGTVQPRDPGNFDRLDVANPAMLDELAQHLEEIRGRDDSRGGRYPLFLVSRRANNLLNSACRSIPSLNRKGYNPACLHPDDLARFGIEAGAVVTIASPHGSILGIAEADETLRPGVVSMTQGFGGNPAEDDDPHVMGSHTGRLLSVEVDFDPVTGIPHMGGIPVSVRPHEAPAVPQKVNA